MCECMCVCVCTKCICVCIYVCIYMCVCPCVFVYFANGLGKLLSIINAHPSKSFPLVAYMLYAVAERGVKGCSLRDLGQGASQDKCGQVSTSPSMRRPVD